MKEDEEDEDAEEEDEEEAENEEEEDEEDEEKEGKEEGKEEGEGEGKEEDDNDDGYGSDNDDLITLQFMTNGSTERKTGKFGRYPRINPIPPTTGTRVEDRAPKGAEDGSTNRSTNPTRREDAVETSRQGQEKLGSSTVERKEIFRNEMTRFGVHQDQIQKILESPNINFNGVTDVRGTPSHLPPQQHLGESATPGPAGEAERDVSVSKSNGRSWCTLQGCVDPLPTPCYH